MVLWRHNPLLCLVEVDQALEPSDLAQLDADSRLAQGYCPRLDGLVDDVGGVEALDSRDELGEVSDGSFWSKLANGPEEVFERLAEIRLAEDDERPAFGRADGEVRVRIGWEEGGGVTSKTRAVEGEKVRMANGANSVEVAFNLADFALA